MSSCGLIQADDDDAADDNDRASIPLRYFAHTYTVKVLTPDV